MSDSPHHIRITREEATSPHVDDMLRRQMSLRGETGVTREAQRRWYYQNWLIFALVGGIAAALAWALIEPHFDDLRYVQGPLDSLELREDGGGEARVLGQRLRLIPGILELQADGERARADLTTLTPGAPVGIYGESLSVGTEKVALGMFLIRNPPANLARKSSTDWEREEARNGIMGLVIFALVAGLIGLFVGAADGIVCRLPRRALLCGGVGLVVGLVGGFICSILASVVYAPINHFAVSGGLTPVGFAAQVGGRSLAWALAGLAMGLGPGLALRSKRLALYGLLGGVLGGLLGGLLFDPIDLVLLGTEKPSAHWSRLVGFTVIGLSVGGLIGVVELLARDAWLRMTQGPLTGKEFLLFKDVMRIGSSPRADLYLFNDPLVAAEHAVLRTVGDAVEIESLRSDSLVQVNDRGVRSARLRHGDTVAIGRTAFLFQSRQT